MEILQRLPDRHYSESWLDFTHTLIIGASSNTGRVERTVCTADVTDGFIILFGARVRRKQFGVCKVGVSSCCGPKMEDDDRGRVMNGRLR